jgi:hypothetical protein
MVTVRVIPVRVFARIEEQLHDFRVREISRQPWDFGVQEAGALLVKAPDCIEIAAAEAFKEHFSLFPVLVQPGTEMQWLEIHYSV